MHKLYTCLFVFLPSFRLIINFEMFQWKNIQLSPEDYENYVHNEDEAQMRVNNLNITQFEWSQLYHNVQHKSQHNKAIKKSVLAYESSLKRLFLQEKGYRPSKEIQKMYESQNNQLRIYISQLFDQISLLHLRNISTTVEFSFSRLLNLEQQLINIICCQQQQISTLKQEHERLQLSKNSQLCVMCQEETQKNRNKLLVRQVFACNQPALLLEEQQKMELSQAEKIQRINREQAKRQENEYEIQRLCYLNSVQEVLRNREKILKCTSAPLQSLLSQYLTQILQMLEESKMPFSQKSIKEYDRVNKSYETIDDMKASINTEHFYKKVSLLLEKPYQNLVENIERCVKSNANYKGSLKKSTVQTQTTYLTEIEQIKGLQKKAGELHYELEHIKKSKSKNELDLINNMESLHRIQVKYIQSVNKNKNLQAENKKLDAQTTQLKNQLRHAKEHHVADQNRILQMNQVEKGWLQREIKRLQQRVRSLQQKNEFYTNCEKAQKEIQTQFHFLKDNMITFSQQSDNAFRTNEKIKTQRRSQKRSQRKNRKRTTIRMEEIQRNLPLPQISHYHHKRQQSLESNLPASKGHIPLLEANQPHRTEIRTKTFKLFTLDPSQQSGDTLIHRVSSRRISPFKTKQASPNVQYEISTVNSATMSPAHHKMRMKKVAESKLKHKHHPSEVLVRAKAQRQYTIQNSQFKRQNSTNIDQFIQQSGNLAKEQKQNSIPIAANVSNHKKSFQQPAYSYRINQPVHQAPRQGEDPTITELLENVKTIAYPNLKEQIKKLLRFSITNYQFLIERNIFSLLYDMGTQKGHKPEQRKCSRLICAEKKDRNEQADHAIDVQCRRIGRRCIQIFFTMEQAEKYEKKMGIWEQYEAFIVIDNNFSKQCQRIQQFFNRLKEAQPMLYQQAILFLQKPSYFCQQIEGKDYETKQVTIFRESLNMFKLEKNWIKRLFEKLMKLHKLLHKNCNHVQKFLSTIGFK